METINKSKIAFSLIFDIEQTPIKTLVQCNPLVRLHITHTYIIYSTHLMLVCVLYGECVVYLHEMRFNK